MSKLKKISSLFLLTAFLFASLGVTINTMICLKSGRVTFSMVSNDACCKKKHLTKTIVKARCCDTKSILIHLNDYNTALKSDVPDAVYCTLFYNVWSNVLKDNSKNISSELFSANLSPPQKSGNLLPFISVFII
jgi:hypothetical protein